MSALNDSLDSGAVRWRDWKTIGLIGAAHSCSHFFQLIFPTLYISLAAAYGYDFVQLGALVSVFFLVSCVGQASSGFVVDRVGGAPVLRFGLACFVLAATLIGLSNGYLMLMIAAVIGGIGNSIFHPADYSLINHRVTPARLGHAYSVHGLTGNLGWALTPIYMAAFIHLWDWRVAAFAAAALVALVLGMTIIGHRLLSGPGAVSQPAIKEGEEDLAKTSVGHTLTILLSQPALWAAFLFFAFTSGSLSAVQNYTIPLLGDVYGIDKVLAGTTLSSYMAAGALGMAVGGFLVSSNPHTERTVAAALMVAGILLASLAFGWLPPVLAMASVALAGFCSGVAGPSRDMLIRRVTPKGATGTVYGLVYSGMDVGSSLAPIGFGIMMDAGLREGPWIGAGVGFWVAAALAVMVARTAGRRPLAAQPVQA